MSTVYAKNSTISHTDYSSVHTSVASIGRILVSDQQKNEAEHWDDAIDQILKFRTEPSCFEQDDMPGDEIFSTAIDFAVDHKDFGTRAPSWIVPSGAGRITFEWHIGNHKFLLEFVGEGVAEYVEMSNGKVVNRSIMRRNPSSRKLELKV